MNNRINNQATNSSSSGKAVVGIVAATLAFEAGKKLYENRPSEEQFKKGLKSVEDFGNDCVGILGDGAKAMKKAFKYTAKSIGYKSKKKSKKINKEENKEEIPISYESLKYFTTKMCGPPCLDV